MGDGGVALGLELALELLQPLAWKGVMGIHVHFLTLGPRLLLGARR